MDYLKAFFGGGVDGDVELRARVHLFHLVQELDVCYQKEVFFGQNFDKSKYRQFTSLTSIFDCGSSPFNHFETCPTILEPVVKSGFNEHNGMPLQ